MNAVAYFTGKGTTFSYGLTSTWRFHSEINFRRPLKALILHTHESISLHISRVMDAEGIPFYTIGDFILVRYCDASLASSEINATTIK